MKDVSKNRYGTSLVEVTLALGIASVCLITIFGLLPIGMQTNQNAIEQSAATDTIGAVIADFRATPSAARPGEATASPQFAINIPESPVGSTTTSTLFFSSDGQFSTSTNPKSQSRLTIRFLPNAGSRAATLVHLKMTWPAEAAPANATGSAEMFLGLDRN